MCFYIFTNLLIPQHDIAKRFNVKTFKRLYAKEIEIINIGIIQIYKRKITYDRLI